MVTIETLSESHLPDRVRLLNDPKINSYLNTNEEFTLEKTSEWFVKRDLKSRFDCVFCHNGALIGMGGLVSISSSNANAELYMYLGTEFQGQGLGTRSLMELCRYGLVNLGLHKIFLYTFLDNARANRMYEKVGFVREGLLREHTFKNGAFQDRCIYGLLKSDFIYL